MRGGPLLVCTLLSFAAGLSPGRAQLRSPDRPSWPPAVAPAVPNAPPLSPAEAVKSFYLPPGYHLELVACEPAVQNPIWMEWDSHGRLWVVEMPAFLRDLKFPEPDLEPICRIVVLESTAHNGVFDKRTVFADHLVLPRSVKVLEQGVLVLEPPNVWLMHDQNGDLHMHTKELIATGFGRREGSVEENANGLMWGLDNWMHCTNTDRELRLKGGKFETGATLQKGEWGISQDDAGRIWRDSNESVAHVDLVPLADMARNPSLVRTLPAYFPLRDEQNEENFLLWPAHATPGTNRAYLEGIDRPNGAIERFTSACGPAIYRGSALPHDVYGNLFVAEPAANVVSRFVISDQGSALQARKPYAKGEFIASTDERFRPVYVTNGPDGGLYVVDMYRGVIQERIDITQYLHGYIVKNGLDKRIDFGRIYRVVHDGTPAAKAVDFAAATNAQLVDLLSDPNGWTRDEAQQLLVQHADASVIPALKALAASSPDFRTRLHALWTLDGIDAIDPDSVLHALTDSHRDVRSNALRLAERWLADPKSPLQAAVLARVDDPDWSVRDQLAATASVLPPDSRLNVYVALLSRYGDDPLLVDAALSGMRGAEPDVLSHLLAADSAPSPQRIQALAMVAATVMKAGLGEPAGAVLADIADPKLPEWQRSALLRGGEIALLGATPPGIVSSHIRIRYPKEDYFFSRPPTTTRSARVAFMLQGEPAAFAALARSPDTIGRRAKAVLNRVGWPGKPGMITVRPLTAEEQTRYDAGREVYRNICQACHQPDGRGHEKMAASLVGSGLALGRPDITARILLCGKEGSVGLMPPIGLALSDDQIASVLTYVRREWGQTGSPVTPDVVKSVRAEVAGRTKPWTNDELVKLGGSLTPPSHP